MIHGDLKALGTAITGALTAMLGWLSINDVAMLVGIATSIITCVVYVWSIRRRLNEQKRHNQEIEDIQRGADE